MRRARAGAAFVPRALLLTLLTLLALLPSAARAQFGASVLAVSDLRVRGVSLSDGRPSARLTLAWDHAGGGALAGAFAGASVAAVEVVPGRRGAALMGYGGISRRLVAAPGLAWEAGATFSHFDGAAYYDYAEAFAGLSGERWNARLSYSPSYYGLGLRTVYAEIDAGLALPRPAWRVFGHAGVLVRVGGAPPAWYGPADDDRRARPDVRLGVGWRRQAAEVQLAWVAAGPGGPYPVDRAHSRGTVVASVSVAF